MLYRLASFLLLCVALTSTAKPAEVEFRPNPNVRDWLRGTYTYLETATGKWRGEEQWILTHNADGTRTMRIFTLLAATELMRDVVHRVGEEFQPLEMFQTTWRKGERTGSGFYQFHPGRVESVVTSPNGRFTQTVDVDGPVTMIPHSMAGDGWHFWSYDQAKGGVQTVTAYNPSAWGDGIQSVLARVHPVKMRYEGLETIRVPAGEFEADAWVLQQRPDGSWVNRIWTYGPHRIMVKFVDEPNGLTYVLQTLEQENGR